MFSERAKSPRLSSVKWDARGAIRERWQPTRHAASPPPGRPHQLLRQRASPNLIVRRRLQKCRIDWSPTARFAEIPKAFAEADKWVRHRLRAVQLKHWKRGRVVYRELVARGMSSHAAAQVAANTRRWWRNSAMALHIALPNTFFNRLGVPRLAR